MTTSGAAPMTDPRLGRRPVPDDTHIRAGFALSDDTLPPVPTPVVIGIVWYWDFFDPKPYKGARGQTEWWLRTSPSSGIAGGHAIALRPFGAKDDGRDWTRFDQGQEGSCVGWSTARALWWMWRRTVDPLFIYREAQKIDPWDDTPPEEGTDVRSAFDVLRREPPRLKNGKAAALDLQVQANRWARSMADVHGCLQDAAMTARGCTRFSNSWGRGYPHVVYIPDELLDRLLFREDGEAVVIVER